MSNMLVVNALNAIGITEFIMRGIPTNETEFNSMFKKVIGEDSNGIAIESSDTSKFGVTWSQIQTALADGGIVAMAELRKQREELLKETDWMSASDYTMTDAWKTYRQALRDITKQTPTDIKLSNITFPTKPTE